MAAPDILPSNYVMPGSQQLPRVSFPEPVAELEQSIEPGSVVSKWAEAFTALIAAGKTDVSGVFHKDAYWRDVLCLTWNFHTIHRPAGIQSFVDGLPHAWRIKKVEIDASSDLRAPQFGSLDFRGNLKCIQSFITVQTDVGRGRGLVRLLPDEDRTWKCYTLFTMLEELTGHEELNNSRRPKGTDNASRRGRNNWKDDRLREENLEDQEPAVLIIGCGQAGLTVAARLRQLGVKSLIVDRSARVGDNWRNRYHHLVLHDSVWFDHMPYLNFPPQWPIFSPKDKIADWFESYAKIMELNIWTTTNVTKAVWNESAKNWIVNLERERDGSKNTYTLHPRHVVLATGASGKPTVPSIPGMNAFKGSRLIHSSEFDGFPPEPVDVGHGKSILVVGSCNSGHDIAQDYYEHGYKVTIVQRSSTLVVGSETLVDVTMAGLYCDNGPPIEDADVINHSFPWPVLKRFQVDATVECASRDREMLSGLQSAGFCLDSGPDAAGIWVKYLSRGGGYYIDTGCSALIANGSIGLKPSPIARINAHSATFEDGSEIEADEIILATGYSNMQDTAAEIFGQEVADKAGPVWGFDEEGETRGVWRKGGKEGFWYMAGNLALCRFYSRCVALGIKGLEEGLLKWEDP